MTFWAVVALFLGWTLLYMLARVYLCDVPPFKSFFDRVRTIEGWLWARSKTILVARIVTALSVIVFIHDAIAPAFIGFDWTPLLPAEYVKYVPLVGILIGVAMEWLRRVTARSLKEEQR